VKKRIFLRAAAAFAALLFLCPLFACEAPSEPAGTVTGKRIAFTFDDGPTPVVTDKILSKLEALGGRATFFQVANRHDYVSASTYEKIAEQGCEIGTHTFSHPSNFTSMSDSATREQLTKSVNAIEEEWGKDVRLFRPVGGSATQSQLNIAAGMGLHTVNWSLDTEDWRGATSNVDEAEDFIEEKVRYIVQNVEDGDIILMHELYLSSYEIFARAAEELVKQGYQLVTVSEILGITDKTKPAAKIQTKGEPFIISDAVG